MVKQINIHSEVAGQNLKQDIKKIAQMLGKTPNAFLIDIFKTALNQRDIYQDFINSPRPKKGSHISCRVPEELKNSLSDWAKNRGSNTAMWSNHLIEKSFELNYSQYLTE